jgi:N-acetylneuraminic acid mutarotase
LFFGGYCSEDGDGTYYDDVHVFNLSKFLVENNSISLPTTHRIFVETKEWDNVTNKFKGQGPSPRSGHGAVNINNKLYVFGGSNYFQSRLHYNDMYILDLGTPYLIHNAAYNDSLTPWADKKTWSKPEQHGDVPCPRTQFSFTAVGDNIYLFGGDLVQSNRYFGDLYEYNIKTHTWRYLFPKGTGPSPRVGHSASAIGK